MSADSRDPRAVMLALLALLGAPVKICPCSAAYTLGQWFALPYVGVMPTGEGEQLLELRNCTAPRGDGTTCDSTIAVELTADDEAA